MVKLEIIIKFSYFVMYLKKHTTTKHISITIWEKLNF